MGRQQAVTSALKIQDSDDYYFTNRFSVDKLIFDLNDDVDAIYNCSHTVFESDVAKERYYAYDQSPVYTLSETVTPEKLFKALLFYWHGRLHTSAITVKREAFQKTGLFSESLRWAEDTELWLRLALKTKMIPGNITEPVSNRLIHDTNVSHQADKASFYKSEMYYSLFRWALDYGCTFENLNDIFNAHKKFLCQQGQLCSDKTLLMKYAKRFIGKITKPFFIKKLFMVLRA
jgi:GT2 family glycosyltransferase